MALQPMYPGKVNSPQTELASAITDTDTTIPLLDASVLPDPPNICTIGIGEDAETVLYTGVSGNDLTGVTRGFQGAAKAWVQGTKVARLFTEYDYDALRQNILSHASRHAAGGPDEITPELIGAETPSGAQAKVNALAGAGNTKTVKEIDDELTTHLADITAHKRTLTYLIYYVNADTGNDNNQGTVEAPFKTIKKAIDSIPVGTAGQVRLLGGTAFSIDTPIYVYNKVVVLEGWGDYALVNITSTIYLIDSTFSVGRVNMYAETSDAFSAIFYCSGIVGIKCGGYSSFNVRPLQETSNVNFIYVSAIAGNDFFTRPVAIYLIGDRLRFRTDNYPNYSGTFNVFAKHTYYTFPVVFTRWWEMTKDANVNWGATEYQLGSSGTSLWYF